MFNNQIINITANENDCAEEHNLSNERKEINNRYFVKRAYTSPRIFKSRRNKGFVCYRMNRSLSFDNYKNDCLFKSPNSGSGSSNLDNEKHLTRSAKIMRALNFNCSVFYNQRKKIKKTLNFNLTPSPKKFSNLKSSRDNIGFNLTTSSPKINKTLNFDTSPSNSSTSSILLTSFDSMDENQNQTPSQRNKKAKKLLDYITPKKRMYVSSPNMDISSPSLRFSLKEKIDDIVQMNCSPTPHSFNQNRKVLNFNTRCNISTPRNLYADFSNEDDERPHTPENTIPIIPESMSAIKKSHKKERSLRQTDNLSIKHANVLQKLTDPFMVEQFDDLRRETRPLSPPIAEKNIVSDCDTNSIKQSHKKDKSRKNISMLLSGDELSDSGSIFEYSIEQGHVKGKNNTYHTDLNFNKSDENIDYDSNSNNISANSIGCCELINSSNEIVEINNQGLDIITDMDTKSSSRLEEETCNIVSQNPLPSTSNANKKNRSVIPQASSVRVMTPENQIDFLQHIQTESIKKSHKKIKDEKRKKLFLPRNLEHKLHETKLDTVKNKHFEVSKNDQNDDNIPTNKECVNIESIVRASTPENVNSSRLLLSNFTSIKKSHKKDKHNKIVSQFIRRQQSLNKDADYNNVQHEMHNDVTKKDQRKIKNKSIENDGAMSNLHSDNIQLNCKVSPSKRKIFSYLPNDDDDDNDLLHLLCNSKLTQSEGKKMEEFKICTPIKKKRALLKTDVKSDCLHKVQSDENDSFEEEIVNIDASRCLTPILRHLGCTVLPGQNTDQILLKKNNDDKNTNNGKSNSVQEQQHPDMQDQNGRSTPKNMSTIELLPNINSIKKSHKKDKRGNGLHRSLILEQEKLLLKKNDYKFFQSDHRNSTIVSKPNDNKSSLTDNTCPTNMSSDGSNNCGQNSTITISKNSQIFNQDVNVNDRKNILTNDTTSTNKTPPNCLMVKNYMRLLQTTSIKKSHKKERNRKKHKIINKDPELSDEGSSIFGERENVDTLDGLHIQINSNETDIDRSDYV